VKNEKVLCWQRIALKGQFISAQWQRLGVTAVTAHALRPERAVHFSPTATPWGKGQSKHTRAP